MVVFVVGSAVVVVAVLKLVLALVLVVLVLVVLVVVVLVLVLVLLFVVVLVATGAGLGVVCSMIGDAQSLKPARLPLESLRHDQVAPAFILTARGIDPVYLAPLIVT